MNIIAGSNIAEVAALIGDVARANMLSALMGGQALTAGELAHHAGVTAQTTSGHLAKLLDSRLLAVERQGRHRYYRLATPEVAAAIDALINVAANGPKRYRRIGPKDEALRLARSCYDHMAGRLAVAVAQELTNNGHVVLSDGAGLVTDSGRAFFCDFGIDLDGSQASTRMLCRSCLDWSERRPHIAGRLGSALLELSLALGWVARIPQSRALRLTRAGESGFASRFGLAPDWRHPEMEREPSGSL